MAEADPVLALLDDLIRLAQNSVATTIEVSADSFSLAVTRDAVSLGVTSSSLSSGVPAAGPGIAPVSVQRVHAPAVGIFSAMRICAVGDRVARGDVLGAVQTLGHIAEIVAPADGTITEVLVSAGVPVEYGQPLFAITLG